MSSLINISSLTKIGNMSTNGIGQLFDGSTATNAYNAATSGYAGVTFASAQKIDSVQIDSQSNGFDASGSTTSITLKLYAKTGSAPSSRTDGTLLATVGPFTDVNSITTKTLTSSDKATSFDHCWVSVETGVWSAAVEIRFYAPDTVTAPDPIETSTIKRYSLVSACDTAVALNHVATEVTQFTQVLAVSSNAVAHIKFRADVVHQGDITGYTGAISLGCHFMYKYASDFANLDSASWVLPDNLGSGRNLCERNPQHYESWNLCGAMNLVPGYYKFAVELSAVTDASGYTTTDGLAKLLVEDIGGLNWFQIDVDHQALLIDNR